MTIVNLILGIAIAGFLAWLVLQIPMPAIFHNILTGLLVIALVVWILQAVGVPVGLPVLRIK